MRPLSLLLPIVILFSIGAPAQESSDQKPVQSETAEAENQEETNDDEAASSEKRAIKPKKRKKNSNIYVAQSRRAPQAQQIRKLKLAKKVKVIRKEVNGVEIYVGVIVGRYRRSERILNVGTKQIKRKKNGIFKVPLKIDQKEKTLTFVSVDPQGIVEREVVTVLFPEFEADRETETGKNPLFPFFVDIAPGVSYDNYSEIGTDNSFDLVSIYLFLRSGYILNEHWVFGLSLETRLVNAYSNADEFSFRLIGFDAFSDYNPRWFNDDFDISFGFGYFYYTSIGSFNTQSIGFRNVYGLMVLSPKFKHYFGDYTLTHYYQFSPLMSGIGFLSLASYRANIGLHLKMPSIFSGNVIPGLYLGYRVFKVKTNTGNVKLQTGEFGVNFMF